MCLFSNNYEQIFWQFISVITKDSRAFIITIKLINTKNKAEKLFCWSCIISQSYKLKKSTANFSPGNYTYCF